MLNVSSKDMKCGKKYSWLYTLLLVYYSRFFVGISVIIFMITFLQYITYKYRIIYHAMNITIMIVWYPTKVPGIV